MNRDSLGIIPLSVIAKSGDLNMVRILIDHCADVNVKYILGSINLLHAKLEFYELAKPLLNQGTKVNYETWEAFLLTVVSHDNESILKLLMDNGANVNALNRFGKTSLQVVLSNRHTYCTYSSGSKVEWSCRCEPLRVEEQCSRKLAYQ